MLSATRGLTIGELTFSDERPSPSFELRQRFLKCRCYSLFVVGN